MDLRVVLVASIAFWFPAWNGGTLPINQLPSDFFYSESDPNQFVPTGWANHSLPLAGSAHRGGELRHDVLLPTHGQALPAAGAAARGAHGCGAAPGLQLQQAPRPKRSGLKRCRLRGIFVHLLGPVPQPDNPDAPSEVTRGVPV